MKNKVNIIHGQYSDVEYNAFNLSKTKKKFMKWSGFLVTPFIMPLVWISKLSPETGFLTASELLSLIPFAFGLIIRYEFYKRTLKSCGEEVLINFGTVFNYPDISIGNYVLIGSHNTIHHCDFGDYVMTGSNCHFLSGSKQHNFEKMNIPIALQQGKMKRIRIEDDVWIGYNVVITEDVGSGSIISPCTYVNKTIRQNSIVTGNPPRLISRSLLND